MIGTSIHFIFALAWDVAFPLSGTGSKYVVGKQVWSAQSVDDRNRMINVLGDITNLVDQNSKRIAYDALACGLHVNDHREAWGLVTE